MAFHKLLGRETHVSHSVGVNLSVEKLAKFVMAGRACRGAYAGTSEGRGEAAPLLLFSCVLLSITSHCSRVSKGPGQGFTMES